jgi:23S rRNA (uracil1939-C5)-methyltransferase
MPQLKIDKLVFGGQGLGRLEGKVVFAWNALPGETVNVEYTRNKKDYAEGVATEILQPSPDRQKPTEEHFLSCSPWQILSWEEENRWKKQLALDTFEAIAKLPPNLDIAIVADDDQQYGYRNKMEYSFWVDENEYISLAFHGRGQKHRHAIPGCLLAETCINLTAAQILQWIQKNRIPLRSLKSLILRSNGEGQTIAALFIKDKLTFPDYPVPNETNLGFQLYYSTHKSPASVPTELLHTAGQDFLVAQLKKTRLKFGLLSFFQVNIPLFGHALDDMAVFLDADKPLLDFYSGVGAIGLPLHDRTKLCTLVDNNAEAIAYAQDNIKLNKLANAEAVLSPAEKVTDLITPDKMIIFDPPRAGLHDDVTAKVLLEKPERLMYLSCNLSTQARDVERLKGSYDLKFMQLYNFFPRTPHIESLVVLDRLKNRAFNT